MGILDFDYNITNISLAIYVKAGTANPLHKTRKTHGLVYSISAKQTYYFDTGRKVILDTNQIMYIPKHSTYRVEGIYVGDVYAINFDIDKEVSFEPDVWEISNTEFVSNLYQKCVSLWLDNQNRNDFKIKSLLYDLLYKTKEQIINNDYYDNFKIIYPAIKHIDCNYTKDISITAMANLCNISDTYFRKLFFKAYNTTPIKYITDKRMVLAAELLTSQVYNIAQIGEICGYPDPARFSRCFKNYYGISPSRFNSDSTI